MEQGINQSSKMPLAKKPALLMQTYSSMPMEPLHTWSVVSCAGPSSDGSKYDWAIVSGGPPKTSSKDGCVVGPLNPGPQDVNNSGRLLLLLLLLCSCR